VKRAFVLAGEHDRIAPPEALAPFVAAAPGGVLHVVPAADHFFAAGLAEIGRAAAAWLAGAAPEPSR
jgi:pimeloyl-ACP methyl ester carboxylesterase